MEKLTTTGKTIINTFAVFLQSIYYIIEAVVLSLAPNFLRNLKSLEGTTILITGGAGGLGRELVLTLVKCNANIIVWDINQKAMAKLQDALNQQGFKIYIYSVDLADKRAIYKTANLVKNEFGPVDVLINNAGIVYGETLWNIPDNFIEKTYRINTLACYWTAKAFLPEMMKRRHGHIVTIGSLTGLLGTYNCSDYSASKYALIGFHESLLTELQSNGFKNIYLTLVCPYFINTGMFDGCKPNLAPMLNPKDVSNRVLLAIRRKEIFCTIPDYACYLLGLKHYMPSRLLLFIQSRVLGLSKEMRTMRKLKDNAA